MLHVAVRGTPLRCSGAFTSVCRRAYSSEARSAECGNRSVPAVVACCSFLLTDKTEKGTLKATDFGLSVFFKDGQQFRDIVGSAYYVAPEVSAQLSSAQSSSSSSSSAVGATPPTRLLLACTAPAHTHSTGLCTRTPRMPASVELQQTAEQASSTSHGAMCQPANVVCAHVSLLLVCPRRCCAASMARRQTSGAVE